MIDEITKEINIIDFEKHLVRFDEQEYLSRILEKYIEMLNLINSSIGLDRIIGQLDYIRCFEEGEELSPIHQKKYYKDQNEESEEKNKKLIDIIGEDEEQNVKTNKSIEIKQEYYTEEKSPENIQNKIIKRKKYNKKTKRRKIRKK